MQELRDLGGSWLRQLLCTLVSSSPPGGPAAPPFPQGHRVSISQGWLSITKPSRGLWKIGCRLSMGSRWESQGICPTCPGKAETRVSRLVVREPLRGWANLALLPAESAELVQGLVVSGEALLAQEKCGLARLGSE